MLLVAGDNVEWISKFYFDLALKAGYKASDEEVEGLKKSAWRFFSAYGNYSSRLLFLLRVWNLYSFFPWTYY